jgi:hypothetical protein
MCSRPLPWPVGGLAAPLVVSDHHKSAGNSAQRANNSPAITS